MKNEYAIINIQIVKEKIKALENALHLSGTSFLEGKINGLKEVISQSTPLIPEIKKAFEVGIECSEAKTGFEFKDSQDYINNLKLNI